MISLPDIQNFERCREYFTDFMAKNTETKSHRRLAAELNWPSSLLGDLVSGRRKLSIARAVEFAHHFQFSGPDSERLVLLAVREIDSEAVQTYVENYLRTGGEQVRLPDSAQSHGPVAHFVPASVIGDSAAMGLHTFLTWRNGETDFAEIKNLFDLFPELQTQEGLREKLELLRRHGIIEGTWPQVKVVHQNLGCEGMSARDHRRSLEVLSAITERPERRGAWNIGQVLFPRALYSELHQRIAHLRNWILNQAKALPPLDSFENRAHVLLQIHLCTSHMLNLEKLGLSLQPDGRGGNFIEDAVRETKASAP